ncbi:hypothetical protein FCV25MIE_03872 [Fagus crenata]
MIGRCAIEPGGARSRSRAYARGLVVRDQVPRFSVAILVVAILIMNGSIGSLAWFSVNVDEPMGIATRDGGGFGLPIWWWGLWGCGVVVVVGGQSSRWWRRRCLGWGLVDTVIWGLRFGVCPPPTVKWVWALGFGFLRRQNGFGRWDVEVCINFWRGVHLNHHDWSWNHVSSGLVLGILPGFLSILAVAFFTDVTVEFLLRKERDVLI